MHTSPYFLDLKICTFVFLSLYTGKKTRDPPATDSFLLSFLTTSTGSTIWTTTALHTAMHTATHTAIATTASTIH